MSGSSRPAIVFRTDASVEIGIGHLKRCLTLAEALAARGAGVRFVTRQFDTDSIAMVGERGFEALPLASPWGDDTPEKDDPGHATWAGVSWVQDARETLAATSDEPTDILIVDHYAFDARWQHRLRRRSGCAVVAIDDLGDRALDADLIVDQNDVEDHIAKHRLSKVAVATILGGPAYAMLAREFGDAAQFEVRDRVASIGIFMGGADPQNCSEVAWRALRGELGLSVPIEIAATGANPHLVRLKELAASDDETLLTVDLPNLSDFFRRHDLQIGTGGGATWERCRIGVPTVAVAYAANQLMVLPRLHERGALFFSPEGAHDSARLAADILPLLDDRAARRSLSEHARALVDGGGTARIAERVLALKTPGTIGSLSLRPAVAADARNVFPWRNAETTRRYFRDSGTLQLEGHVGWWKTALVSSERYLMIAETDTGSVGVVRFDVDDGEAEISIYVDPSQAGRGFGQAMIKAAINWAERALPLVSVIIAEVLQGNDASRAAFMKAGFDFTGTIGRRRLAR